jgi:hypothetical protein
MDSLDLTGNDLGEDTIALAMATLKDRVVNLKIERDTFLDDE